MLVSNVFMSEPIVSVALLMLVSFDLIPLLHANQRCSLKLPRAKEACGISARLANSVNL
jgi:hypothetical protein